VAQLESVGDVIGRAVRLFRLNYTPILQALFVPTIVCVAGRTLLQWGFSQKFSFQNLPSQFAICLVGLVIVIWACWRLTLIQLAMTVQYVGDGPNYKVVFESLLKKQMQIFHCFWIQWAILCVNAIVWSLFGISAAILYSSFSNSSVGNVLAAIGISIFTLIGLVGGTVAIIGFWAIAIVISSMENEPFAKVCDDCVSFVSRDFWRVCYFVLALIISICALLMPLYLPPLIVGLIEASRYALSHPGKHLEQMPFYLLVFGQTWESIVNMVVWPIYYFSVAFFYQDLKIRQRASDVLSNLEKLKPIGASGA
jgi:hypothetical protein